MNRNGKQNRQSLRPTYSGRRLLWLDDGRIGHQRQCWALISALQRRADFMVHRYRLPAYSQWRYRVGGRWLLDDELRGLLGAMGKAVLMISAGRRAAAVSMACSALAPAAFRVQLLDPRQHRRRIDLLVVPEHDRIQGDNIISMRGSLHDLRPEQLPAWRRANADLGLLRSPRYGLLLGGNRDQNEAMFKTAAKAMVSGGSVLISTSPRFGSCAGMIQRAGLSRHPDVRVFGHGATVQTDADRASSLQLVLAWSDVFMVAADSINQLNELMAVRDQRPIWVADHGLGKRHQRFLQPLLEQRLLQPLTAFDLQPQQQLDSLPPDTAAVADAVMTRLAAL